MPLKQKWQHFSVETFVYLKIYQHNIHINIIMMHIINVIPHPERHVVREVSGIWKRQSFIDSGVSHVQIDSVATGKL